ncbi:MAG: ATP-binding protein [Ectothiorhodospiraceae bacterium AqS1]|nr:ATP-binding protein [Ectothiorhodospiraceae bacterium AqS1]
MIPRAKFLEVEAALKREAAVILIGPRQVGKTTLAHAIGEKFDALYLDLENAEHRARLGDTDSFLMMHRDRLVILDEIHRAPGLFETLRGVIDEGRRKGKGTGRFLLLGSASIDLMRQSESLAGRIEYIDLAPFDILELGDPDACDPLWLRGGFPRSFLAATDNDSLRWRSNFIRTVLERDIPMFGPRLSAPTLERLWRMLAHSQGGLLNATQLGRGLEVSTPTVTAYIDLLVDLLLVRRLPPLHAHIKKRLVKSPKTYLRDSGLVHALLGIESLHDLLGHPVVGMSWEGMVIETLLGYAPFRSAASFYRTAAGAEIDLVLEMGAKHGVWAIEIKRTKAPKMERGFRQALADIQPDRAFIVYGGQERYPKEDGVEVIGMHDLAAELHGLS